MTVIDESSINLHEGLNKLRFIIIYRSKTQLFLLDQQI